jgi:heme exporter protein A
MSCRRCACGLILCLSFTKNRPLTPRVDTRTYGAKPLNLRDSRAIAIPSERKPMPERRLQAENLHLWRGERHVLRGVRFAVNAGECLQITGGNGAGKTSLLRTLSGLMYPEEGTITWCGGNIRRDMQAFHAELAYIGHEPPLKPDLTAQENLHYWVGVRRNLSADEIDAELGRLGADQWRNRPIRTLSAGQKRRVALAGLLLMAAPLWLLDEPTTNLDVDGQRLVGTLIEEHVARGGLVVAAIHHELAVSPALIRRLELSSK